MTEPIEPNNVLHLLTAGRIPFRRWRWELWHGSRMLAAWGGRPVALRWGDLRVVLTPRALLEPRPRWLPATG